MTELDVRSARPDQLVAGDKGKWEIIVGLEVHAQVTSQAKLFSGASAAYGGEPNSHVSLVDAAMPGMLPVINRFCVEQAIRTGLGLNAEINRKSRFDRKNYFYPDLPQGYQISQYKEPIVGEGAVEVDPDGEEPVTVRIERLHLEQDAGKSIHDLSPNETFVDLNRSGVALMEIVSRPDMRSAKEAAAYFNKLRAIVRALGTCDGNMEEGSMRADVNVSVRRAGTREWGTRCEIKNVNSTRFMMQAIEYEARRQIEILEGGGTIDQETRLFDAATGKTRTMRSKEDAHDYRYFPDPDLLPLVIEEKWIEEIKASLPELPDAKRFRYKELWHLNHEYTNTLVSDLALGEEFEELTKVLLSKGAVSKEKIDEIFEVAKVISKACTTTEDGSEIQLRLGKLSNGRYLDAYGSHGLEGVRAQLEEHGSLYWGNAESAAGMLCVSIRSLATERKEEAAALAKWSRSNLADLILLIKDGTINGKIAKDVFAKMMETGEAPGAIVEREGLKQVTDTGAIEKAIDDLIAAHPDKVDDVKKNPKAFGWWVGQTMKATGGKANPGVVNEILKKKLGV